MTVNFCTLYTVSFRSGTTREEAENCLYWENSFSVWMVWLTRKYSLGVHSTIERSMLPEVMCCGRRWGDPPDVRESFFFQFSARTNTFIWLLRQKSNDVNLNMNPSCSTGPRRHIKPKPMILGLWNIGISAPMWTRKGENEKTDLQKTHISVVYSDYIVTWHRRLGGGGDVYHS